MSPVPAPTHVLERPTGPPAGPRDFLRDVGPQYFSNAFIGMLFGVSGPVAVTLAVGIAGGLTSAELASWIFGIFLSTGLATITMSMIYRRPFGFAFTIPGTVLLGPALMHLSWPQVVGAFYVTGILCMVIGASGLMRKAMQAIPMPIVMAMVAAIFLRFGTDLVTSVQTNVVVAAPMVIAFIALTALPGLGRYLPPVLGAFVIGAVMVALSGQFQLQDSDTAWYATPVFTPPEFTAPALMELVVPLAITVLVVQNGQGIAVLRAADHDPPINMFAFTSGFFSVLNATVGGVSACVTGPTNVLLTASGEKQRQYTAAVCYGFLAIMTAVAAPGLTRLMLSTPEAFILALGGIAMLRALQQAFVVAFSTRYTLGALVTFVVTISGLTIFNINAAFWGILIGYTLSRLMEPADYRPEMG
ncbi:benzoate transporter [Kocuria dechangensis]|uniref:Benzoate transporter n=1 Tax=Kocuria dechangensis TaxID=1176249 RepID=A0A917M1U2_9MICC|nr:benzoate/H(+) symporter BenE family transporter [Kocuria dechangensis]GGG72256.1 benzoate transporter [Kocuria dechangensis]